MQFRLILKMTLEEYIALKFWEHITIIVCPIHPGQDCGVRNHGTYPRVGPLEGQIVRGLCKTSNITFSLLPDFYSSRLPGTLIELEEVVLLSEKAEEKCQSDKDSNLADKRDKSFYMCSAIEEMGIDHDIYEKSCDVNWLNRRIEYVTAILIAFISLFPEKFGNCQPTITSFQSVLGDGPVLIRLRKIAGSQIHKIPKPVGLNSPQTLASPCYRMQI